MGEKLLKNYIISKRFDLQSFHKPGPIEVKEGLECKFMAVSSLICEELHHILCCQVSHGSGWSSFEIKHALPSFTSGNELKVPYQERSFWDVRT